MTRNETKQRQKKTAKINCTKLNILICVQDEYVRSALVKWCWQNFDLIRYILNFVVDRINPLICTFAQATIFPVRTHSLVLRSIYLSVSCFLFSSFDCFLVLHLLRLFSLLFFLFLRSSAAHSNYSTLQSI